MADIEARTNAIRGRFEAVCGEAGIRADDVIDALLLRFLRGTYKAGECGPLMADLENYLAGGMDIPLWRHHSAPPVEAFQRPAGR